MKPSARGSRFRGTEEEDRELRVGEDELDGDVPGGSRSWAPARRKRVLRRIHSRAQLALAMIETTARCASQAPVMEVWRKEQRRGRGDGGGGMEGEGRGG